MILAVYVGFSRLNHLQYLEREPMLLGILRVARARARHVLALLVLLAFDGGAAIGAIERSLAGAGLGGGEVDPVF
ncbi:MAG: hypothetical protein ACK6DZ_03875 [Acidobacteriota bacterium]